jgi:hypothetical protein
MPWGSNMTLFKNFLIRHLKATILKFDLFDEKTFLLLAPGRKLICLRSVAVSYLVRKGFFTF